MKYKTEFCYFPHMQLDTQELNQDRQDQKNVSTMTNCHFNDNLLIMGINYSDHRLEYHQVQVKQLEGLVQQ